MHYFLTLLLSALSIFPPLTSPAQKIWKDEVYKEGIESVLLYRKGNELSLPIIKLETNEQITFLFDEIGLESLDYVYTIIHCNPNWSESDLLPIDYIEGFQELEIYEYSVSQNTLFNYINYKVEFPNEDINITKSGNYIIKVYERDTPESPVITRRFYVYEEKTKVKTAVEQIAIKRIDGLNQRLNIDIECYTEIENPAETVSLHIIKNNGPAKDFSNIKPSFIQGNNLIFKSIDNLAFAGGNEYRHFDIKNFKFVSDQLLHVEKLTERHDVILKPDKDLSTEDYKFKHDINGKRTIKLENNDISNIMADYCYVYFQLSPNEVLQNGEYFINSNIYGWNFQQNSKLEFNSKKKVYQTKLLLKQGYYNYNYLFQSNDKLFQGEEHIYKVEKNSHYTENEYHILIYYKDYSSSYTRIIGYDVKNSTISAEY